MPSQPGDRVVWRKQTPGGGYVAPVLATVLAVTARRVKIEAEDGEGTVIRHVMPRSIEHHAPAPEPGGSTPQISDAGRSEGSGQTPSKGRSKGGGTGRRPVTSDARPESDEVREERITREIVVDADDADERAMGW